MRFRINNNPDTENERCNYLENYLGFDTIDILQFNYDGKGGAICLYNGAEELDFLTLPDVEFILFDVHYTLEMPVQRKVLFEGVNQ